ncbi:dephospho-CoA kinase [Clostridium tepidiprofundi DSM 19306]|uniref:Dephospho-CoA kinase n=1 Tax=Clostridium tepidiprofundi DSM 19306 TaxID=1121338 RepID=A0A151B2X9_9CLOT|nr:dephospho-CoA kinase [Clostridium tepidiprofundi]KYH34017.1 dephospho-CoA kinase [Clostridium tepidiprofundi DSM 19306]
MIKVGLTGGIGSGKSTVSRYLINKGIPVIDADKISRDVLTKYKEILESIKDEFGEQYVDENCNLKRRELGRLIFSDETLRKKLEDIIIPYIKNEIFNKIEAYEKQGKEVCIVDAPTLIENNLHELMDINILIWVDEKTQIERVIKRDVLSLEDVQKRIASQMPLEEKKKYVDYVIDNRGNIKDTLKCVDNILKDINKGKD